MEDNKKMDTEKMVEILHNIKAEDLKQLPSGGFLFGDLPKFDCDECEEAELEFEPTVEVELSRYDELMAKATAFDILTAAMKRKGEVSDDIVWAVTGAEPEPEIKKLQQKSDDYWRYYTKEKEKTEELQALVVKLRKEIEVLEAQPAPDPEVNKGE